MRDNRPLDGYVDPNFPNPNGPQDAPIVIYGYTPSLALGVLGVVLFSISTILHSFQLFRYRTWYFTPLTVGTLMEVIGYIFRLLSTKKDPYNITYFVVEYFFIVIAPVFFSAAIYTILSVLINALGKQYSPLPPKAILWLFIASDVIATIVQVAGSALIGSAESNRTSPSTPNNILLAGLAFQVFSFLVYILLLGVFLYRSRKMTLRGRMLRSTLAFGAATLLVYLRTCFRLAETSQGVQGRLRTHESFFGALEFTPIVIAVFIFNAYHPGKWVPSHTARPAEVEAADMAER